MFGQQTGGTYDRAKGIEQLHATILEQIDAQGQAGMTDAAKRLRPSG